MLRKWNIAADFYLFPNIIHNHQPMLINIIKIKYSHELKTANGIGQLMLMWRDRARAWPATEESWLNWWCMAVADAQYIITCINEIRNTNLLIAEFGICSFVLFIDFLCSDDGSRGIMSPVDKIAMRYYIMYVCTCCHWKLDWRKC